MKLLVGSIRETRQKNQLQPKQLLPLFVKDSESARAFLAENGMKELIMRIAYLDTLDFTNHDNHAGAGFIAGTEKYYLIFEQKIDVAVERKKLEEELKQKQGFVLGIEKKLSNEQFVSRAAAEVIETERKKLADGKAKIKLLEESLSKL